MDEGNASNATGQSTFEAIGPLLGDGFSVIPNVVLRNRALSGLAKAAWALIYDYTHRHEPSSMETLEADLGVGEKAARKVLRELETAGLILRKRHGQGRPNTYRLAVPESLTLPEAGSRTARRTDPSIVEDVGEDAELGNKFPSSGGGPVLPGAGKARPVFDAIATATSANPAASGGEIAKAEKAIRAAEADTIKRHVQEVMAAHPEMDEVPRERIDAYLAEKVQARAARYRELRPDWALTPSALAKHWLRIPTFEANTGAQRDEAEKAWQRVLGGRDLTVRDKAALKAIGGSFTVRSSTHLPTTRRDFIAAWDDSG